MMTFNRAMCIAIGILCVAMVTIVAMLVSGHNGAIMASGCTVIGGLVGYAINWKPQNQ